MNGHIAIYTRLGAYSGLTALVSTRIYASVMPDNPTYPAVTYHQTDTRVARGALTDPGLVRGIFNVTSWGETPEQVRAVADQVRLALNRLRATTVGGVAVDDCFFEGDFDLYDPETKTYSVSADFRIHYREA